MRHSIGLGSLALLLLACGSDQVPFDLPPGAASETHTAAAENNETVPPSSTAIAEPTATAPPTTTPAPPPTPVPIVLSGTGNAETDVLHLGDAAYRATITHTGDGEFLITVLDSFDLRFVLVDKVGPYEGSRPLHVARSYQLTVTANGPWTISISPLEPDQTAKQTFVGSGDSVSGFFNAEDTIRWFITSEDPDQLMLSLHCTRSGTYIFINVFGATTGGGEAFAYGNCFWDVRAEGAWTVTRAD